MELDQQTHLRLYRSMYRIRRAEMRIAEIYKEQIIRTPTHLGVGQEAVAVGVCEALNSADVVYSHHRSHNHYLAKGGDLYAFIAELMGKEDGCSRGRGGSAHLTDLTSGFIASIAILTQAVSTATGSALAFKMDKLPNIAVAFFGDAALEEGGFWEAINYAAIHKLPVLYICENNGYSTESSANVRQPAGTTLSGRVASLNVPTDVIDGNDVVAVYEAATRAVQHCRSGKGPMFLEFNTYRWLEHVGPYFDHELGRNYRSREELEAWMKLDPIPRFADVLTQKGVADRSAIEITNHQIDSEVEDAIFRSRAAAWPVPEALFQNVY